MKRIRNIHPGEILSKEFLHPMHISRYQLARNAGIRLTTISSIIKGRQRINTATANKLSGYFGNTPRFWLELQQDFDLNRRMRS